MLEIRGFVLGDGDLSGPKGGEKDVEGVALIDERVVGGRGGR